MKFIKMINGVAFSSATSGLIACASLIPFALYAVYILLTVSYDVDKKVGQLSSGDCCGTQN